MKKSFLKKQIIIATGLLATTIIPILAVACNNDTKPKQPIDININKDKQESSDKPNNKTGSESGTCVQQPDNQTSKKHLFFSQDQDSNYSLVLNIPNTHGKYLQATLRLENKQETITSSPELSVSDKVTLSFKGLKPNSNYFLETIKSSETRTSINVSNVTIPETYSNQVFITKPLYETNFIDQKAFENYQNTTLTHNASVAKENFNTFNSQQWYDLENDFYLTILYNHYSANGQKQFNPLQNYDNGTKITSQQKEFFDQKAKLLSQETYDKAALKGFTLPIYKNNSNEILGLSLKEGNPTLQHSDIVSNSFGARGTTRILGGQKYKDIALQTVSINFLKSINEQIRTVSGTMWILDFVPTNNQSYPTKWYFATNAHVAKELLSPINGISLTFLKSSADISKTQKLIKLDNDYTTLNVPVENKANFINTIYVATDFLESKPSDFLTPSQANKYSETEEFVDFAVFEVDFEELVKVKDAFIQQGGEPETNKQAITSAADLAKLVTNNYATNTNQHIKFLKTSYLQDYQKINGPILDNRNWVDSLYTVGYPVVGAIQELDQTKERTGNALWTNSFYTNLVDAQRTDPTYQNLGNLLSKQLGYRSFIDKAGIVDGFIAIPKTEFHPLKYNNKHYWNMALEYSLFNFAAGGGSSGSSVRNQNNEIVGIVHLGNPNALLSVAAALRSEGFDYKGLYGKYNLPQYDLIYGGGMKQKTSYRQALVNKYGINYRTNIFKDNIDTIPADFIFKKA